MSALFQSDFISDKVKKYRIGRELDSEKEIVERWNADYNSGKLSSSKEESIKSEFIREIFGDILGYNYGNSNRWMLEEEYKSSVDATKCDAALGFFYIQKQLNDTRAIIEVKSADVDLDKKQKGRKVENSPVEQAFLYSTKQGGNCKWVIVTNFVEIRFYHHTSQEKFQSYTLDDLRDYQKLKEIILLFHRDNLITNQHNSKTESLLGNQSLQKNLERKEDHILNQMYYSLLRFDGFEFVDPKIIANCQPFNILSDYVWHYDNWKLFTINPLIYDFLKGLDFDQRKIVIDEKLKKELEQDVDEYSKKIEYLFETLFKSMIHEVIAIKDYKERQTNERSTIGFSVKHIFSYSDEEGVSLKLNFNNQKCNCLNCTHKNFDYKRLFEKLDLAYNEPKYINLEYAYGFYLVSHRNYRTSYSILRRIQEQTKNKTGSEIEYFLAKLNLNNLRNLLRGYDSEDQEEIKKFVQEIDIDYTISNEVEPYIDKDVRRYLIEIKEQNIVDFIGRKVDSLLENIIKIKLTVDSGTTYFSSPDYIHELHFAYSYLHQFFNRNFIIYDVFTNYKSIFKKVFEGLCISYNTADYGLSKFNSFYLKEAVLLLQNDELKKILKDVNSISIDDEGRNDFIAKANNLIQSFYSVGSLNSPHPQGESFLNDIEFKWSIDRQISNSFILLIRIDLNTSEVEEIIESFTNLIKVESFLAHWTLTNFGKFVSKNAQETKCKQLLEILKICILSEKRGNIKYEGLSLEMISSINKFHEELIDDKSLIMRALSNSSNNKSSYNILTQLYLIVDSKLKTLLLNEFLTILDESFNSELYEYMLIERIIDIERENYFEELVKSIKLSKGKGYRGLKNSRAQFDDFYFYNFVLLLNEIGYEPHDPRLSIFDDLTDYELWLLNPKEFDYSKFKVDWILVASKWTIDNIGEKEVVKNLIENQLSKEFNSVLSERYFKYFMNLK